MPVGAQSSSAGLSVNAQGRPKWRRMRRAHTLVRRGDSCTAFALISASLPCQQQAAHEDPHIMHTQNTALQVLVPMHTHITMKDLIPSTLLCQERATKRNRASFDSPSRHIECPMRLKSCSLSDLDKQARCSRLCSCLACDF